jgi:uncharacterized protein (TIGR02300 family)
MDISERGTKRICPTTGKKFYDLNRDPIISPYTGEVVPISSMAPMARGAAPALARKTDPDEDEAEAEGPELVSLDEVESEEGGADDSSDSTGDDDLTVEDDSDTADDDVTLIEDEDDDDTSDLVDVEDDDED